MSKMLGVLVVINLLVGVMAPEAGAAIRVARNGKAECRIVVSPEAPPATQYAAQELQRFLGEITGASIEIVPDTGEVEKGSIIVGPNKHFEALSQGQIDLTPLGNEGYVLRGMQGSLIIAGGEPRGTLYGVYGLLEDHLGYRWFTPEVSRFKKDANLRIKRLNERVIPPLEYREPFVMDCFDGDWAARNRMNSSAARLEERHGGKVTYFGFVHTFEQLVPPDKYFDEHPEYFSLVKGKRLKERSQLCCMNPDVVRIVIDEVRKRMRENPEATVFSVSQNDWYNYCECDACQAVAEAEGTQMGPVLDLVNQVARAVADEFPDKVIDTLAYQYTRKAPKTMRPEPNVIIRLCSIECCFSHSFEACDSADNVSFVQDVKDWSERCNRLWVWNYNTSFSNYLTPFPNLRVRKDNIQFFAKHNVTGIFEQDVYTTLNGEFSGLSGYLGAKLLWDPEYDDEKAIDEFLDAVYGKAAKPIRQYLDLIHDKVDRENLHMNIWIGPDHPLLDGDVLEKAEVLWDEAEAAVANEAKVLERVRVARLSFDYAQIERSRAEGLKMYCIDHDTRTLTLRPEFAAMVQRFFEVAQRNGVTNIREWNGDINLYREELETYKDITAGPTKTAQFPEGLQPGLRFAEYDGVWERLPDFKALTPIAEGVAKDISLEVTERREALGLTFEGYIYAPEDGLYIFHCRSNDGSKLYLGGKRLINNDGLHKMQIKSGIASLEKGYHLIRVTYFESGGEEGLEVYYEGPGIGKQLIPAEAFWHVAGE